MAVSPARLDAVTKSLQSSLKLPEAQPSFARLITTSWIGPMVLPWKEIRSASAASSTITNRLDQTRGCPPVSGLRWFTLADHHPPEP